MYHHKICTILSALLLLMFFANTNAEEILSKENADYIFGLDRNGWETYVQQIAYPNGWKTRLKPVDTGTGIMSFNTTTGYGLSIQPIFTRDDQPPDMLIVGSYYPVGTVPIDDPEFVEGIKQAAERDLGDAYSISDVSADMPPYEGIELMVTTK